MFHNSLLCRFSEPKWQLENYIMNYWKIGFNWSKNNWYKINKYIVLEFVIFVQLLKEGWF